MKKYVVYLSAIVACVGCEEVRWSAPKTEGATVVQLSYVPARSFSTVGVGFTTGGNMSITPVSGSSSEVYAVVLRCDDHNAVFAIQSKALYDAVAESDIKRVELVYQEKIAFDPDVPESGRVVDYRTTAIRLPSGGVIQN